MNPITVFLTVACLAVGAGLNAIGYLYAGVPVVIAAIVIASALKMANMDGNYARSLPTCIRRKTCTLAPSNLAGRG